MSVDLERPGGPVAPRFWLTALVAGSLLTTQVFEAARVSAEAAPSSAPQPRSKDVSQALESGDAATVQKALAQMKAEPHDAHVELLVGVLERGGSEPVVSEALAVAEALGKPRLSASVAPYVNHRVPRVRHAAARALAKTGGPEAVAALRLGLRSSDGILRDASAAALGKVGDPSAAADLFLALDRGMSAAAPALGLLCDDTGCRALLDHLNKVPFEAMSEGLVEVVLRTDKRVESNTKVEIVARIANLRTPQAASTLRGAKARWPQKGDPAVFNALDAAIDSFGGR